MDEKWYAVYTKPRWEKKVAEDLSYQNIHTYCPLNRVVRQWSDRKKIIQEPLFTSYVFVHISENQITDVKKTEGVLNFVYWLGKPAVIQNSEIETIRNFLKEHSDVKLERVDFNVNDNVRVTTGSLLDMEGRILAIKNNTICVALPTLGYVMYAEINKSDAVKIRL